MTISWVTSTKYRNILKTIPCLPHGGETLISSVGPHPLEGSHSHYRLTLHSKGDKVKALGDACTAVLPSTVALGTQISLSPVSVSWTVSKASGLDEPKFCKDTHLGSLSWERCHIFFLFFPCLSV